YSWPGNVRELRNVIEQYVLTGSENAFSFDGAFCKEVNSHNVSQDTCTLNEGETLKETVARFEEGYLRKTLERCQGNVSAAAKSRRE
ncbi:AAA family ATPase, partial [Intestinimonas massiliensis]